MTAGLDHIELWGADLDSARAGRRMPGLTHLAFAGGPDHYAEWLENSARFKVETVAEETA